ncbi:MAG: 3-hydroxyacyl-ACP dehydratase FabZ [Desulfobulbaceae bacterium]|jgi:3-hydroxyacyl-[acyl-carrier-protein] dehydratase|nr:3-hydroxyacyl-ACP dehydratase FabZ [Desulfobulbaceae bacterium]MDY0350725.1 3-hydroxyacyl-ACP dehydratase FabZ [Desulfobulbaceae bacterium]
MKKMHSSSEQPVLDIKGILAILPHRYPFVLVDRIVELEVGKYIVGLKNVTINEPCFQGHFPGEPVMPGVLILEGMAQVGALLAYKSIPEAIGSKLVYFAGLDGVRFRKVVRPGDQIIYRLEIIKLKSKLSKMSGKAFVDDQLVAEGELMASFA